METTTKPQISDLENYTINWTDIENTDADYDFYLDEIENFFREDFENDILEDDDLDLSNNF